MGQHSSPLCLENLETYQQLIPTIRDYCLNCFSAIVLLEQTIHKMAEIVNAGQQPSELSKDVSHILPRLVWAVNTIKRNKPSIEQLHVATDNLHLIGLVESEQYLRPLKAFTGLDDEAFVLVEEAKSLLEKAKRQAFSQSDPLLLASLSDINLCLSLICGALSIKFELRQKSTSLQRLVDAVFES